MTVVVAFLRERQSLLLLLLLLIYMQMFVLKEEGTGTVIEFLFVCRRIKSIRM